MIARLGLRASDVANLRFENINWETNKISFYQVKTKKQIELPLLKDVGESIIEYMKYGRPTCNSDHIFVRHRHLYMNLQHLLSALLSTGIF